LTEASKNLGDCRKEEAAVGEWSLMAFLWGISSPSPLYLLLNATSTNFDIMKVDDRDGRGIYSVSDVFVLLFGSDSSERW
jgi:hypothetical protein